MSITYTRNRKTTQQEMLDTAKNYLVSLRWTRIKLQSATKRFLGSNPSGTSKTFNEKEQSLLENGSITQEQYDNQQKDKIGKTIR